MKAISQLIKYTTGEYHGVLMAYKKGHRAAEICNKNMPIRVASGIKNAQKRVGIIPLVGAGVGLVAMPIPGGASLGFCTGLLFKMLGARVLRLLN